MKTGAGTTIPYDASGSEDRVYAKVPMRIVQFLFVCYLADCFDRVNVGFAKLHLLTELTFDDAIHGFGAGIFFLASCCSRCRATCYCSASARSCGSRAS